MAKQHDLFLKDWLKSRERLDKLNSDNGTIFSADSLDELLLVCFCLRLFSVSFADFDSRCKISAERNPLFGDFMEWSQDFGEFSSGGSFPIKIGDLGENDPSSVLMKLTAITSGQKTNGVFYTPNPMARFVSIKALQTLKKSALDHKSISVLEPSIGSGVFVRELLPLIEKKKTFGGLNHLQKVQIIGIDLSPAAILVTEFLLANFDCQLESKLRISLFAGNTLSSELHPIYQEFESWRLSNDNTSKQKSGGRSDANTSLQIKTLFQKAVREKKFDLVIGNPPFSALTGRTDQWSSDLLHGKLPDDAGSISYFEVEGQKLAEKKTWLHDDYVKFLRYAHWQIDRNESGCVAFVLNSGFINNLTFRGLRFQLAKSFDQIEVIDFGGDQRNRNDRSDENLFGIETGIAVLILGKTLQSNRPDRPDSKRKADDPTGDTSNRRIAQQVQFYNVHGIARDKFDWCERYASSPSDFQQKRSSKFQSINLVGPKYRFDQSPSKVELTYEKGWCVTEIASNHWSAPVTARDHLIIDASRERLVKRIESFLDPNKSDDEIRKSFFPTARSNRYPHGDTRGWSLSKARERLRQLDWKNHIITCAYRPFDQRFVLWMSDMIDWPRSKFYQQFSIPDNFCFITRRQAPLGRTYDYFWMASQVPVDGIIRSDNRGNEYCFPKQILNESGDAKLNLSGDFRNLLRDRLQLPDEDHSSVFDFLYGQAFSRSYRNFFENELPQSFPRFFIPNYADGKGKIIFDEITKLGKRLRILHTQGLTNCQADRAAENGDTKRPAIKDNDLVFSCGKRLKLSEKVWQYRVGTHDVCKKFIANYWKITPSHSLIGKLEQIADRIEESIAIENNIESTIDASGGFQLLFLGGQR